MNAIFPVRVAGALVFVLAASVARAVQWESQQGSDLCGASFDGYVSGEALSNKGATNGTWGTVPTTATVAAASDDAGHVYLNCKMPDYATTGGIVFTPDDAATGIRDVKSVMARVWLTSYEEKPVLDPAKDRTGFTVYRDDGDVSTFIGWTKDGWRDLELPSGAVSPAKNAWRVVSIRLAKDAEGKVLVQYRISVGTDSDGDDLFEPLRDATTKAYWFEAGGSGEKLLSEVEFRGDGHLDSFSGKEPKRGLVSGVGAR